MLTFEEMYESHRRYLASYGLVVGIWLLSYFPKWFINIPKIWNPKSNSSLKELLPPHPKLMSQAYKLGRIEYELLNQHESKQNELLIQASNILNHTKPISKNQFLGILPQIEKKENEKSKIQRVLGLFSFINIIWFISIIGIAVTIFPVIYHTFDSIHDFIKYIFNGWLYKILKKIFLSQLFMNLYEFILHFICFYWIYIAINIKSITDRKLIGFYLCFTGIVLYFPLFEISRRFILKDQTNIWNRFAVGHHGGHYMDKGLSYLLLIYGIMITPLVNYFHSKTFGFIVVYCIYDYLGFFVQSFWGGYIIGFDSKDSVDICIIISGLLSVIVIILRFFYIELNALKYFKTAIIVMSNIVLLLALLIKARKRHYWDHKDDEYVMNQFIMIFVLVLNIFFGHYLHYPSMRNTSYVFTVLYFFAKIAEVDRLWEGKIFWYTTFSICIIWYKIALYLNKNPGIIVQSFSWDQYNYVVDTKQRKQ